MEAKSILDLLALVDLTWSEDSNGRIRGVDARGVSMCPMCAVCNTLLGRVEARFSVVHAMNAVSGDNTYVFNRQERAAVIDVIHASDFNYHELRPYLKQVLKLA